MPAVYGRQAGVRAKTTHSAMGRFGNVLLPGGETDRSLRAELGEVVRLYLTNTANTRVFKVALPGARMKLVGGDSGHVDHEELIEQVVLAPSARTVVDVLFDKAGSLMLEHRTPARVYRLATVEVNETGRESKPGGQFERLRTNADLVEQRERIAPYLDAEPDKTLAFMAEMHLEAPEGEGPIVYGCPMHPEVVSEEPASCRQRGMKLLATATTYTCPDAPRGLQRRTRPLSGLRHETAAGAARRPGGWRGHSHGGHGADGEHEQNGHGNGHDAAVHDHGSPKYKAHSHEGHGHTTADGIEWEDDMVAVNRLTTPANMRWKLIDRQTGDENAAIDWRFRVGDQVKIRLLNEMAGDHPMHHPFHIHGAGRFLVLSRDGVVEPNLVWKDTVLVRAGGEPEMIPTPEDIPTAPLPRTARPRPR
jgi:FtsP/CotA-like multicopper oxidase with cupredoxin domain